MTQDRLQTSDGRSMSPGSDASATTNAAGPLCVSAALGLGVWLLTRVLADLNPISSTLGMAVLVVVPLGLSLIVPRPDEVELLGWLSGLQPLSAVGAVVALILEPRAATSLFTLPWVALTLVVALVGVKRMKARSGVADLATGAGLILLPVGGLWLAISRADLDPLGVGTLVVLLTAVHFHFAAFGGLLVLSRNARELAMLVADGRAPAGLPRALAIGVVCLLIGICAVAAGISGVPLLGLVGAGFMTVGLFLHAFINLFYVVRHLRSFWVKALSCISSLSILLSMPLALGWAYGQWVGSTSVKFTWMLRIHGMANAHGFVFAGLLGWWLAGRKSGSHND